MKSIKKYRKEKQVLVKVNKPALGLVIAIFLIEFLIALEFNSGIVSAAVNSVSSVGFSSSSSNPQYYRPATTYSQQNAYTYWPALENSDKCEATSDFIINIRPGSCTPAVIRSDLLEENNVPVFCKVDIVKLNPLIDITQLKSVSFTKKSDNPLIAGVSFHPNAEAINYQRGLLNNPFINDVGYVVVVLKKIPAERDMPESIKVNLTGVLRYDLEGLFGAGKNEYYLTVDDNWNTGENYKDNSFFKGKGYLRLDFIESGKAGVSIYRDKDTKISSFTLEKGKTSNVVYMPGFYCKAGVKLSLNDIESGVNRVKLEVDGEDVWLVAGERFLDGECRVNNIELGKESVVVSIDKTKVTNDKVTVNYQESEQTKSQEGEVSVDSSWVKFKFYSDKDKKTYVYALTPDDKLMYYDESKTNTNPWVDATGVAAFNTNLLAKLQDIRIKETTKTKDSVTITCQGLGTTKLESGEEKKTEAEKKAITETEAGIGEVVLTDAALNPDNTKKYFNLAKETAYSLVKEYGEAESITGESWGAKALLELGELADKLKQEKTAQEIYNQIINKYLGTDEARQAAEGLNNLRVPSANYNEHFIKLLQIKIPGKDEASADFIVENTREKKTVSEDGIQKGNWFSDNKFELVKLYQDKVDLIYHYTDEGVSKKEPFSLEAGKPKTYGDYRISLANIHLKQIAKVSLSSFDPRGYSDAEFTFEIGIEKRAIQLSPDKIKSKIAGLNESIKKWEEIVNKLGNAVKVMKGVCLATSSILLVKNFFSNLRGGATARQKAMPIWYKHCQEQQLQAGGDKKVFDQCLQNANPEIQNDVGVYTSAVTNVNNKVLDLEKQFKKGEIVDRNKVANQLISDEFKEGIKCEGEDKASVNYNELVAAVPSIETLRDAMLSKEILASGASETAKADARKNLCIIANRIKGTENLGKFESFKGSDSWMAGFNVYYSSDKLALIAPIPGNYELEKETKVINADGTTRTIKSVNGFYAVPISYTASGIIESWYIKNIGADGKEETGDEPMIRMDTQALSMIGKDTKFFELSADSFKDLATRSQLALRDASASYGKTRASILGTWFNAKLKDKFEGKRCTDFMSPQDCKILFNVCDPVLCPSSRCDLGGSYKVDNVIQSGIIGSLTLCLPNFVGFGGDVVIPVCISGVYAGLDAYVAILKAYKDCLQEQLDTGRVVGICDEVQSINLCEFFWRQIGPSLDLVLQKAIESSYGQGMKGGGEYLTVQDAWSNLQDSINYMKNDYALNSYKAFNARSTAEIGSAFCKSFVSARYPSNKDFFDNLLQPDSPVQFSAWFDERPYTEATAPATSSYKVFYFIYAGKDEGVNYQVYLKNPPQSAYVYTQDIVVVQTDFVGRGNQISEARDIIAPAGYKELCVRINGQDNCGFGKVSTSFAINYISDQYYKEQLTEKITTEDGCVSGTPSISGMLTNPNIQAGVETSINPELESKGIVRICASSQPGSAEPNRWLEVGYCGDQNVKCYLDKKSVENVVKNTDTQNEIFNALGAGGNAGDVVDKVGAMSLAESQSLLANARKVVDDLKGKVNSLDKTSLINSVEKGAEVSSINLKQTIADLERVKNGALMNNEKGEAVYWKFVIYKIVAERLYLIDEANGPRSEVIKKDLGADKKAVADRAGETGGEGLILKDGIKIYLDGRDTGLYLEQATQTAVLSVGWTYRIWQTESLWGVNQLWPDLAVGYITNDGRIIITKKDKTPNMKKLETYTFDLANKKFISKVAEAAAKTGGTNKEDIKAAEQTKKELPPSSSTPSTPVADTCEIDSAEIEKRLQTNPKGYFLKVTLNSKCTGKTLTFSLLRRLVNNAQTLFSESKQIQATNLEFDITSYMVNGGAFYILIYEGANFRYQSQDTYVDTKCYSIEDKSNCLEKSGCWWDTSAASYGCLKCPSACDAKDAGDDPGSVYSPLGFDNKNDCEVVAKAKCDYRCKWTPGFLGINGKCIPVL